MDLCILEVSLHYMYMSLQGKLDNKMSAYLRMLLIDGIEICVSLQSVNGWQVHYWLD